MAMKIVGWKEVFYLGVLLGPIGLEEIILFWDLVSLGQLRLSEIGLVF